MVFRRLLPLAIATAISSFATSAALGVDYVVPSPCATIQEAIDLCRDGDRVIIKSGLYGGPGNGEIDFRGKAITVRSETGNPADCTIDCSWAPDGTDRGFVFKSGETRAAVLEGITIRNGYKRFNPGGALRISHASPTIRRCWFNGNRSFPSDTDSQVYVNSGQPLFENCGFNGGKYAVLLENRSTIATFDGCSFMFAWSGVAGGNQATADLRECYLAYCASTGVFGNGFNVILDRTLVEENAFAGLWLIGNSTLVCDRSSFWANGWANAVQGGMGLWNNTWARIRASFFGNNYAAAIGAGNGSPNIRVDRCEFWANDSGLSLYSGGEAEVVSSTAWGNNVGFYSSSAAGSLRLTFCTIAENGLYGVFSSPFLPARIANSIVWHNGTDIAGSAAATYSDVGTGNIAGKGNIHADPLFVSPPWESFEYPVMQLQPTSPCVNKGTLSTGYLTGLDINGNPRVAGTLPDMGAYELPFAITGFLPERAVMGTPGLKLTVVGSAFAPGIQLLWNGSPRGTTLVSRAKAMATISPDDLALAGTVEIRMVLPNGEMTPAAPFVVGHPRPVIGSLAPNSMMHGGPGFTVEVIGTGFGPFSTVRWNGAARPTTFNPSTGRLTATIFPADYAAAGTALVTVANSAPGGGVSNVKTFRIK